MTETKTVEQALDGARRLVADTRGDSPPENALRDLAEAVDRERRADEPYEYMVCIGGACDRPEDESIADGGDALRRARVIADEAAGEGWDDPVQIIVTRAA